MIFFNVCFNKKNHLNIPLICVLMLIFLTFLRKSYLRKVVAMKAIFLKNNLCFGYFDR
jgi:hypothetical protein